jgi:hypothetical protein
MKFWVGELGDKVCESSVETGEAKKGEAKEGRRRGDVVKRGVGEMLLTMVITVGTLITAEGKCEMTKKKL